jgi:hypothetical protein
MPQVFEGSSGAAVLAARIGRIPEELQPRLRPVLREGGTRVKTVAAGNAAWSSRIPRSLMVRLRLGGRSPGVLVVARQSIAPHARAYEGMSGRGDTFRHPVMGDRDVWVSQAVRPFLAPAVDATREDVADDLVKAVDDTVRKAGFA